MGDLRARRVCWAAVLVTHVIVTALTWRDIRHRAPSEIRGPKRFWRIASAVQMGNSLAYWFVGRRRVVTLGLMPRSRQHDVAHLARSDRPSQHVPAG